jgi:ABC-2 type transport system permease protein
VRALAFLIRKEFLQIRRDPALLRLIFAVPIVQLLILGSAANVDLERVPVSFLDQDQTAQSRALQDAFLATTTFVPGPVASSPEELRSLLDHDEADLTVWIPRHYARDLAAGRAVDVGIDVDGINSAAAGKAAGYASRILQQEARRLAAARGHLPQGAQVEAATRFFYNPELVSRTYMVPGILVILVTIISGMMTGMAVVREKEIGTLEQLLVTPLKAGHLVAGKVIPFAILSYVTLTIATVLAVLWFHIPIHGSLLLLAACMAAYLLVTLGVGLLASTVSSTQQQAMFTVWFFLIFGILMSGFFYPIANMPSWAQVLTYANPMRYIMAIVRGILLKGAGAADLWPQIAALAGIGVVVFTGAVRSFAKRVG